MVALDLSNRKIFDEKLVKLLDEQLDRYDWRNLRILNLEKNLIERIGCLMETGRSLQLSNLRVLNLNENQIDEECSLLCCGVENFINLKELYLRTNFIRNIVVRTQFPALETLDLSGNCIGNQGVVSLLKDGLENFPNLRKLVLSNVDMKSLDPLLMNCHNCPKLKCLDFSNNFIYNSQTIHYKHFNFPLLDELYCSAVNSTARLQELIVEKSLDSSLTTLDLSQCYVGEVFLKALSLGEFKKLTKLLLSNNEIGNEEVLLLGKLDMPNLVHLNLDDNLIGLEGANIISNFTNFPQLEFLSCRKYPATKHKTFESYSLNNFLEDCREELGEELEEEEEDCEEDYYGGLRNSKGKEISFVSSFVSFTWTKSDYVYVY
ncbi:predicted protein [Naegleria gruberi]|uniref:Predicted protein n=1 Tax=Naegleria gruberi TaxID=5762 RepID=D2V6W3_NAEGR|nr:uncharacterized protein NAEGRDRAFT_64578 [Naegleria gruberi]EFC47517.1 predicted protein [Naegleria gruberi]|eukprot:XP_002680261.1 predicted protein [Naegleria gruberi strain NEG-M]